MQTLTIPRSNHSECCTIRFDEDCTALTSLALSSETVVITNPILGDLYADILAPYRTILVEAGEAHKTLSTVESIHRDLLAMGMDRKGQLVGFGGGIITDITGFTAATYMRGVRCGFVATSLLAQVDASVGGKNGVNLDGYKNIIGTFNQPDWVICPRNVLHTLPRRELLAGYAEVIKCGLLRSTELFDLFRAEDIDIRTVVQQSVEIKAAIVTEDEHENGVRKLLNLGHTFGHGIEKCSKGAYLHGEAVAIGMAMAARASVRLGLLPQAVCDDIIAVITQTELPVDCPELAKTALAAAMASDKKKDGTHIEFILLRNVAEPVIWPLAIEDIISIL